MSAHEGSAFCTVFDCMDGRCQAAVGAWCHEHFGSDKPDTITIAGADGVLAEGGPEWERALRMAKISAEAHGSKQAVIVGHSGCAGYQASADEHKAAVTKASGRIAEAGIFETVVGLFDDLDANTLTEVCRHGAATPAAELA